jgi:hypothetical protein
MTTPEPLYIQIITSKNISIFKQCIPVVFLIESTNTKCVLTEECVTLK